MKEIQFFYKYISHYHSTDTERSDAIDILQSKFPQCPVRCASYEAGQLDTVIAINPNDIIVLKYDGKRYDVVFHDNEFIWSEFMQKEGYTGTIDELVEFVTNNNRE